MEEKRRFQRVSFREAVLYRLGHEQLSSGCVGHDISAGGIRCHINDFIPLGQELNLTVNLAREQPLEIIGRVVWIQKNPHAESYEVGLRFINMEKIQQVQRALDSFVGRG